MSTTTTTPDTRPFAPSPSAFGTATHALSLTLLLAAPLLVALPPRKLDLYTFSLASAWLVSANHLTTERTGASIASNLSQRFARPRPDAPLPLPRAVENAHAYGRGLRGEEAERARGLGRDGRAGAVLRAQEGQGQGEGEGKQEGGVLAQAERLWMGDEAEGWKERRLREEQEALAEGKGYWDLIAEQVWEVWNWGRKDEDGYGYGRHGGDVEAEKRRVEALKREKGRGLGGE
ncbi:hypothetical protein MMC27_000674 [Xylographa pallens]|nr:hypothetical protein [Xylographa pallens]